MLNPSIANLPSLPEPQHIGDKLIDLYRGVFADIVAQGFAAMKAIGTDQLPHLTEIHRQVRIGLKYGGLWLKLGQRPNKVIEVHGLWHLTKWAAMATADLMDCSCKHRFDWSDKTLHAAYDLLLSIENFLVANRIPYPDTID